MLRPGGLSAVTSKPGVSQWSAHRFVVVAIGSVDHCRQRYAACIRQQLAFDPALAAIRQIVTGSFLPKDALPKAPSSASQVRLLPLSVLWVRGPSQYTGLAYS